MATPSFLTRFIRQTANTALLYLTYFACKVEPSRHSHTVYPLLSFSITPSVTAMPNHLLKEGGLILSKRGRKQKTPAPMGQEFEGL